MKYTHTPGPWRWELNEQSKSVSLVGGKPQYDKIVMDFARYGMGHAAPRFNDAVVDGKFNIMERCEKYAVTVAGREHHANWFKDISHPDARLITAAPDLLAALAAILPDMKHEVANIGNRFEDDETRLQVMDDIRQKIRDAEDAIAKATGSQP